MRRILLALAIAAHRLLQRTLATQGWINRRSRGGWEDEAMRMAEAGSALRNVHTSLSSFGCVRLLAVIHILEVTMAVTCVRGLLPLDNVTGI